MNEDLYDRLRRQENWNLSRFAGKQLVICGDGKGMTRTLALAALCSGWPRVAFVGDGAHRMGLIAAAEELTLHAGPSGCYAPVYPPAFAAIAPAQTRVWVIDAGDPLYDGVAPVDEPAFFYAEGRAADGVDFLAVGRARKAVARDRKGLPVADRAEIPAACAQLLTGIFADIEVSEDLATAAPVCRIPLAEMTGETDPRPPSLLYAGGGGAIAHQEMWAAHLDPVLRNAVCRGRAVVVDPKLVHESCRARQWGYGSDALYGPKAEMTARWLERLFPGLQVQWVGEKLAERHFADGGVTEALSSIDNWSGRKTLADQCRRRGIPWWSVGSSFYGGFARQISAANPWCADADHGVERLRSRPDDGGGEAGASCTDAATPQPSSVLPQMVLGSFVACRRRDLLLGRAEPRELARGLEVHLTHGSRHPSFEGLRWSPGRGVNLNRSDAIQE